MLILAEVQKGASSVVVAAEAEAEARVAAKASGKAMVHRSIKNNE
jgi:hypothetical protein